MSRIPPRPATYADLEALPANQVGEIIDGVLYASPRPATPHAFAATGLAAKVGGPFGFSDDPGGWIILIEPELHLGPQVMVPDLAGWRRTRMPQPPDTAAISLPPDWLCEVLSPSTMRLDRRHKLPVYAQAGVTHVWLLEPIERTLEIFALDGATYRLIAIAADAECGRFAPFEAIELELPALWRR